MGQRRYVVLSPSGRHKTREGANPPSLVMWWLQRVEVQEWRVSKQALGSRVKETNSGLLCHFLHVNLRHVIDLAEACFHVCTTEMISAFLISQGFLEVMLPPQCTRPQQNWRIL